MATIRVREFPCSPPLSPSTLPYLICSPSPLRSLHPFSISVTCSRAQSDRERRPVPVSLSGRTSTRTHTQTHTLYTRTLPSLFLALVGKGPIQKRKSIYLPIYFPHRPTRRLNIPDLATCERAECAKEKPYRPPTKRK